MLVAAGCASSLGSPSPSAPSSLSSLSSLSSQGPNGPNGPTSGAPSAQASGGAAPMPADCRSWNCHPSQTRQLPDGAALTLWVAASDTNYRSKPILELTQQGVATQWWESPQGDGWNGSLTCQGTAAAAGATSVPNCVLIDSIGMHASLAQMLVLGGGRLVPSAEVVDNAPGMRAVDLSGDGYLDLIGTVNDYKPDFAQGHDYWQTQQYLNGKFLITGCAPQQRGSAPPTQLLTGTCPAVP